LRTQSLEEIINSEHHWDVVNHMRTDFDVFSDCVGCCRHDQTNLWLSKYLKKPQHVNFI
jgi:hypothetical protein